MRSYTLQTKVLLYMLEQETKDGSLFFSFLSWTGEECFHSWFLILNAQNKNGTMSGRQMNKLGREKNALFPELLARVGGETRKNRSTRRAKPGKRQLD